MTAGAAMRDDKIIDMVLATKGNPQNMGWLFARYRRALFWDSVGRGVRRSAFLVWKASVWVSSAIAVLIMALIALRGL